MLTGATHRDFPLPDLGEGLVEAEIVQWLVQPGDPVALNQPLVEVETAKAAVEIPSPYAGVVAALHRAEGDLVPVGAALLTVDVGPPAAGGPTSTEPLTAPAAPAARVPPAGSPAALPVPALSAADARTADTAMAGASTTGEEPPAPVVGRAPVERLAGEAPRRRPRRPAVTDPSSARPAAVPAGGPVGGQPEPSSSGGPGAGQLAPSSTGRSAGSRLVPPVDGRPLGRALAAPPVRRLARDLGVDLVTVRPTGPNGTVVRADVTAAATALAGTPAHGPTGGPSAARPAVTGTPAADAPGEPERPLALPSPRTNGEAGAARPGKRVAVRGVARHMALAMERSAFGVPQATVSRAVDITGLLELLARWRAERDAAAGRPARITPLAFTARAVVAALARHPLANARWLPGVDGSHEIEMFAAVNLGVAVASDRGLVVPVIHDADRLALPALAAELAGLVEDARAGHTAPGRLRGATVTVSNVGVFGVDSAVGLVREGEAALVVLGAIRDTPAVWRGQLEVRKVMIVSVSFDHRILDGAAAARFLGEIAEVLEDPPRLLLLG